MDNYMNYNFEELLDNFEQMDTEEIIEEYAMVVHAHREIIECGDIDFTNEHIEQLDLARDFLGHYLACTLCHSFGYEI